MGPKFTLFSFSTDVLTFPKTVVGFKVIPKITRCGLVGWVVVGWGTGSYTSAEASKDIGHELVTGWEITSKKIMNFGCCKNTVWKTAFEIIISILSVELNQLCKGTQLYRS